MARRLRWLGDHVLRAFALSCEALAVVGVAMSLPRRLALLAWARRTAR